ncbi:MAG: Cj0069 family protein [Treponema sp.]|nr:Cj0069 family protein [Treponema sp.]
MTQKSIAFMLYGEPGSSRDVFTDEKYRLLAEALVKQGFSVDTVLYHDSAAEQLEGDLAAYNAVLVWVNPIEQGGDRRRLDKLLRDTAGKGVPVYTHPDTILKIGTKKVLYTSREMDWGGDTDLYATYDDFEKRFISSLSTGSIRILKQYRGNGGNGVFKVSLDGSGENLTVIHAPAPLNVQTLSKEEFLVKFRPFFENDGLLINQKWAEGIINGMVRCYLTGDKVSGFGYQESNALCPESAAPDAKVRPVSSRYYFSEDCGLFQDLRNIMEEKWVPEIMKVHSLDLEHMPLLWDIDLFINDPYTNETAKKYTLCEINVSCVSPFPPSCVRYVVEALKTITHGKA